MAAIGKTLYGTTGSGYALHGAVFSIDTSGHEAIVYRFRGRPDGAVPNGDLLAIGNVLYGTTKSGGSNPGKICTESSDNMDIGCGTVFSITLGPSGPQEKVLYRFRGGADDGKNPQGGLISVNGLLYGVTPSGGQGNCGGGCGTVFSVNPTTGQEIVLYKIQSSNDAWAPVGNLAHFNGMLYGASYVGGLYGNGTVFALELDGSGETIVHSFTGGRKDGSQPVAGVVLSNGIIYGTTGFGGNGTCLNGCGTIYSITP
ncbi:MAG TPA: choice-of-anchor tandem repeat GloVer-containing protein [Candidatus Tumulicola sp.]